MSNHTEYYNKLCAAMTMLGKNDKTIFLGQSTVWEGHALFATLKDVPSNKKIELPVMEDFQAGMSLGLALEGYIPINIYPRFDFLLLATNQIFNHTDNIKYFSNKLNPKVIFRVSVGSKTPMDPGIQHCQNYVEAFKLMSKTIDVIDLMSTELIIPSYEKAINREDGKSTILVEYGNLYTTE